MLAKTRPRPAKTPPHTITATWRISRPRLSSTSRRRRVSFWSRSLTVWPRRSSTSPRTPRPSGGPAPLMSRSSMTLSLARPQMTLSLARPQHDTRHEADAGGHGQAGERRAPHELRDVGHADLLYRVARLRQRPGELPGGVREVFPDGCHHILEIPRAFAVSRNSSRVHSSDRPRERIDQATWWPRWPPPARRWRDEPASSDRSRPC